MEVRGISKALAGEEVVRNLSLTLHEGEVFCLLGHNGAGKSTTLNILGGLLKSDEGSITIKNPQMDSSGGEKPVSVGVCLQSNILYEDLTVEEHVWFYGVLKGISLDNIEKETDETLESCAIADHRAVKVK